jgi:hypothetical protein
VVLTPARFPDSDTSGSTLVCQLPGAFRRLPRPSSPLDAKTSTVHPYSLDHVYRSPPFPGQNTKRRGCGDATTRLAEKVPDDTRPTERHFKPPRWGSPRGQCRGGRRGFVRRTAVPFGRAATTGLPITLNLVIHLSKSSMSSARERLPQSDSTGLSPMLPFYRLCR